MNENILSPTYGILNPKNEKAWESCQMYGSNDKGSPLGTFYCDLDCGHISTDDQLLLCQIGVDGGDSTVNSLEIVREGAWLIFNTYVEAAGGYQDIISRHASGKSIKVSIRPEVNADGEYDHIRFMVYDADIQDVIEAMYVRTYSLPSSQRIDRVAMILRPDGCYGDDYSPCRIPVGVNNFRAYGIGDIPGKLKPNFEWFGEEFGHKNERIVSRHYESYKLNRLANLKQWKETV